MGCQSEWQRLAHRSRQRKATVRRLRRRIRSTAASAGRWLRPLAGDGQGGAATVRATADLNRDAASGDLATTIGTLHLNPLYPSLGPFTHGHPELLRRLKSAKSGRAAYLKPDTPRGQKP
jgi:hypothetical protein